MTLGIASAVFPLAFSLKFTNEWIASEAAPSVITSALLIAHKNEKLTDSDDQVRALKPGLTQALLHLLDRLESVR